MNGKMYSYRITQDPATGKFKGTCLEFPHLYVLEDTEAHAYEGILDLVEDEIGTMRLIKKQRPPEPFRPDPEKYTYKISWSGKKDRFKVVCKEFPDLVAYDSEMVLALTGIIRQVAQRIRELIEACEDVPLPPYRYRKAKN